MWDGWGNGCEKVVVACRLVVSASGVESGCVVVELALRLPEVGRMSVRGRRKGALPCATRAIKAYAHEPTALHDLRRF